MLADRNLLVIVPALNEEATVGAVVARAAGASVMSHPFNLGVGAALRTGFRFAVDRGSTLRLSITA